MFLFLQANETGGSATNMELEGAKRCLNFLLASGIAIAVFVSDRHKSIAKWIRETQPQTKHFYDIWHVARSISNRKNIRLKI